MSTDTALLKKERMHQYKALAVGFSYPEEDFFTLFPEFVTERESIILEYDQLFRGNELWLYGSEYTAGNEFQRAFELADISGFYRAFGLVTDKERPDALPCELEFMHYLIFKEINAQDREKALCCASTQKKFFQRHLYPAAKQIADKIITQTKNNFYQEIAKELIEFLKDEKIYFKITG